MLEVIPLANMPGILTGICVYCCQLGYFYLAVRRLCRAALASSVPQAPSVCWENQKLRANKSCVSGPQGASLLTRH